ncbi:MAG: YdiU family protein [Pseudomonadales bacterium]|nr:YdiU family protein [Pseudomonadales bacterium]
MTLALDRLHFDDSFTESLPEDPISENYRRQVNEACFSRVQPQKFPQARLVACSRELATAIGLSETECSSPRFTEIFSGTHLLEAMQPYACCYGGHQFGHWAGQLGDGRAINLGELRNPDSHWILQLKGAGPTPYSRTADGLAVLRSSVREFLCSEAMYHLGVPTTRALSLIVSGEEVVRDMFYDGHPRAEPGAIVCRVAPSFIRFGSFEIFARRSQLDVLKQLADYTIRKDFPHLGIPSTEVYGRWFNEICQLTASLLVHWMRVGFVHGVMNTDNMSILGLTIDYGPYGWLEGYDPGWTPNTTDAQGKRYRFGQQPQIALWNLVQLANALYPLINAVEPLESALDGFQKTYGGKYREMMAAKLGLRHFDKASDDSLIADLEQVLQTTETDMTLFFRSLANMKIDNTATTPTEDELLAVVNDAFYNEHIDISSKRHFAAWLRRYRDRVRQDARPDHLRQQAMNAVNPLYVLRNWLAQQAIDKAENGDYSMIHELQDVLRQPYDEQAGKAHLAQKRPEWARHRAGCSMLSCSS